MPIWDVNQAAALKETAFLQTVKKIDYLTHQEGNVIPAFKSQSQDSKAEGQTSSAL